MSTMLRMTSRAVFLPLAIAVLPAGARAAEPQPSGKPNVLFIAIDDLNNSLGCYGDSIVKSPHIDRLASRGVRFDRAYCQYPLCNPSRTSFLSGRRPDTTQIFDNGTPPRTTLGKDLLFLPEHFRKNGYFTARVGKIAHDRFADAVTWDVSEPAAARAAAKADRAEVKAKRKAQKKAGGGTLKLQWRATGNDDRDEPDGRTALRIVQLLEEHKDQPFFIAAGFHKPHLPWVAPRKYFALYPPEQMSLPQAPADDRGDIPPIALTRTAGDDEMTAAQKREAIAAYHACTSFTDAQVGLLLDALDRLKLADKTIVVCFGDHGFHLGEHNGLWRKMTVFEESARVPLIIAAPGKRAGAASPRLVELVDLYPTLTELCSLPTPEGLEGTSLVPLLDDPDRTWKRASFTTVYHGRTVGRSVRTERYRYTEWGSAQQFELYDHQADPHEYNNLAQDAASKPTVEAMQQLLREGWRSAIPSARP